MFRSRKPRPNRRRRPLLMENLERRDLLAGDAISDQMLHVLADDGGHLPAQDAQHAIVAMPEADSKHDAALAQPGWNLISGADGNDVILMWHAAPQPLPQIAGIEPFLTDDELRIYREAEQLLEHSVRLEQGIASLQETIGELEKEKERTQQELMEATGNAEQARDRFAEAEANRDSAAAHLAGLQTALAEATERLAAAEGRLERAIQRKLDLLEQLGTASEENRSDIDRRISDAESDARRADGAATRARERIERLRGQIPAAEQALNDAELALDKARRERDDAEQDLMEARSNATLACTRLAEIQQVLDRLREQVTEVEAQITLAREQIGQAIARAGERLNEFEQLETRIATLQTKKTSLQTVHSLLGSLIQVLQQDVGTEISPEVRAAIEKARHDEAVGNFAEVIESLEFEGGIRGLFQVVQLSAKVLTELGDLLFEATITGPTYDFLATYLNTGTSPHVDIELGQTLRDYVNRNRNLLQQITGEEPPGAQASTAAYVAWLRQNALALAIGLARAGGQPGEPVDPDNILNNAAINYLLRQQTAVNNAINDLDRQIGELRDRQGELKRN